MSMNSRVSVFPEQDHQSCANSTFRFFGFDPSSISYGSVVLSRMFKASLTPLVSTSSRRLNPLLGPLEETAMSARESERAAGTTSNGPSAEAEPEGSEDLLRTFSSFSLSYPTHLVRRATTSASRDNEACREFG